MTPKKKIKLIREQMANFEIDAYVVPASDPHASEYLPEYYKTREWASGFTGSAGTLIITKSRSGLWTDGRYYIQAEKELEGSGIELIKMGQPGSPTMALWLKAEFDSQCRIGFNGFQMMTSEAENLEQHLKALGIQPVYDHTANIIDKLWLDRPHRPCETVHIHDLKFAGESATDKLNRVREKVKAYGACCHMISKLDDIAWLLNLRGNDILNNPYFMSYLFIKEKGATLYVAPLKLNAETIEYLRGHDVEVKHYKDIIKDLEALDCEQAILIDKTATAYHFQDLLNGRCKILNHRNPSTEFKATKTATELEHIRQCYKEDGAAVVRFLYWLQSNVGQTDIDEIDIDEKITGFRQENPLYAGKSFDTIAAYKDHGAIMHYRATPETVYAIKPEGLLLVDSGGQYQHGTTDITRTVAVGPLSDQEKFDYTLTLKSMMALSRAIFLEGATGTHLDPIARQVMWSKSMDYKSGTGHGIGYFLGVHEGPQRISMHLSDVPLTPGMVVSNEPGVYRTGVSGVRLENILAVVPYTKNEFGTFLTFETLTLCPFDTTAIDVTLLDEIEKAQLNAYHQLVREHLTPLLEADVAKWLEMATEPLL